MGTPLRPRICRPRPDNTELSGMYVWVPRVEWYVCMGARPRPAQVVCMYGCPAQARPDNTELSGMYVWVPRSGQGLITQS